MHDELVVTLKVSELEGIIQNAFKTAVNELQSLLKPQMVETTNDEYLTQFEASQFLNCSIGTLINWKKAGKLPYRQIGKKVLYSKKSLLNLA